MSNAKRRRTEQQKSQRTYTVLYVVVAVVVVGVLFAALTMGGGGGTARASPAPAWRAVTLDGEEVTSEGLKGQVYVVDFFYTWCPRCAAQYPHKVTLMDRFGDRDDFKFFSVNSDPSETQATIQAYKDKHGSNWPYIKDESGLLGKFKADARPFLVFVDRDGNIGKVIRGIITPGNELIGIAQGLLDRPAAGADPAPAGNATSVVPSERQAQGTWPSEATSP